MTICETRSCTGCFACMDACQAGAIEVTTNDQGFTYPHINEEACIECGRCASVCPVNVQKKNAPAEVPFACWDKNKADRLAATSGGVFTMLARQFIVDGGVVYGAAFDEELKVTHTRVDSVEGVERLRRSKYVQSDTRSVYSKVKEDLKSRKVLFSGTPCQVAALKNCLGKDHDNLLCVDIMCHGVPSPMVFEDYKKWLQKERDSKLRSINFRYKKPGWTVFSMKADFDNGKSYISSKYRDPYHCFFLLREGDLTLRESCFECRFTSPERVGDITLADFWQYRAQRSSSKGSEQGVGLVLLNTDKGRLAFEGIKVDLVIEEHTWQEANKSNLQLREPNKKPQLYDGFWEMYRAGGFQAVLEKYWQPDVKGERKTLLVVWKRAHEYLLPKPLRK